MLDISLNLSRTFHPKNYRLEPDGRGRDTYIRNFSPSPPEQPSRFSSCYESPKYVALMSKPGMYRTNGSGRDSYV